MENQDVQFEQKKQTKKMTEQIEKECIIFFNKLEQLGINQSELTINIIPTELIKKSKNIFEATFKFENKNTQKEFLKVSTENGILYSYFNKF